MPRRRVVAKREVLPDPKFGNVKLAKFMNHVMISGKKSVAEGIVYGALALVSQRLNKDPIEAFDAALDNIAPAAQPIRFPLKCVRRGAWRSPCVGWWITRAIAARNRWRSVSLAKLSTLPRARGRR